MAKRIKIDEALRALAAAGDANATYLLRIRKDGTLARAQADVMARLQAAVVKGAQS